MINLGRLPKDPTEIIRLLVDVGILDAELEPSGEFHRRWRRLQIAIEKSPWAMQKAVEMKVNPRDSAIMPAIISFFPDGLHEKDCEIIYNHLMESLDRIQPVPLKE